MYLFCVCVYSYIHIYCTYVLITSMYRCIFVQQTEVVFFITLEVEPMCQLPDDLPNSQFTISLPVSTVIDSNQLHHNIVVMGGSNRNATNVTDNDETALMFLLGSVVRYTCNDGYVMTGNDTLMCFSDGLWFGDIGSCEST